MKYTKTVKRNGATRPLAALVPAIVKRTVGTRGFRDARILHEWPQIVGEFHASHCHPDRLVFPKGRRESGILYIRAEGPMATELQHLAPVVIGRINAHFGYKAVNAIKIIQAPPHPVSRERRKGTSGLKPKPSADPKDIEALAERLLGIEDPKLRAVLGRMGEAVLKRNADRLSK